MSEIQHKEWQNEQNRVDYVAKEINNKVARLRKNAGEISSDVFQLRKTFWEDVTVNFDEPDDILETHTSIKQQAELLSERERTHKQMDKQLKTLARLKYSPYFGRIDFHEKGEAAAETVYLGIASFMDKNDENFLIYDWRAPISSLYYDYSPGPAQYATPEGIIEGEMELKRQFIIRESHIKGMFETGVTIGDEMLQEVLGNNASTQMKSIVATIQKEQNQIIRNETSRLLFVQGVAGSGKTSAALQRVAYLLYRYRGTITSENILLFSPNPLFNSYVATVLPELGEENMQQTTFQEYLTSRLGNEFEVEDPFSQMEYLLSNSDNNYKVRVDGIRYKASLNFKNNIDQYVQYLSGEGLIFRDITFRKATIFSKKEIEEFFYTLDRNYSIPNRMQLVKEWLLKELKRKVKQERSKSWVEEEVQFLDKDFYVEAFKKLQEKSRYNENTFDDFEREQRLLAEMVVKEKFKPVFRRVKKMKFIDLPAIYLQLFKMPVESAQLVPENWVDICATSLLKLRNLEIAYEDATPFVYLQDLIEGRKSNTSVRHIFIDEAQDYSPFQFAYIQMLFPYSKMTLLGDYNQAIFSGATGSATVLTNPPKDGADLETIELMRTYRSTRQIVEFTKHLIVGGDKIEPFNRNGNKPVISFTDTTHLNQKIINTIENLEKEGHRTIAVICLTAGESKRAYEAIRERISCRLIEKGTVSYEKGVLILPAYLAKGIEFDAVILYDSSLYKRESERKLFYTACTRAMHELRLFATNGLSPLMEAVPTELYIIKKTR